jgi:hypothetical protein
MAATRTKIDTEGTIAPQTTFGATTNKVVYTCPASTRAKVSFRRFKITLHRTVASLGFIELKILVAGLEFPTFRINPAAFTTGTLQNHGSGSATDPYSPILNPPGSSLAWNFNDRPHDGTLTADTIVILNVGQPIQKKTTLIVSLPIVLEASDTIEISAQQNVAGQWTVRYDILGQALEVAV